MEVNDGSSFHRYVQATRQCIPPAYLTYEGTTTHPDFGECTLKIYRAIGNDSALKVRMTIELLKKHEPNSVGMWPGDRFEYWRGDNLIAIDQY